MNEKQKITVITQIGDEEGFSAHEYKDTRGFNSIGKGYNLDANPLRLSIKELQSARHNGINEAMATLWLMRMVEEIETKLSNALSFFSELSEVRQAVLICMAYQMGCEGLMGFKNTLLAIRHSDYELAAISMLDSKWAKQTPARAHRMAKQIETGEWQHG